MLDEAIGVAKKEQLSYPGFLAELLLAEVDDRDRRSSIRRVKAAQFPRSKWLGDFDFDANPAIEAATIHQLAKGRQTPGQDDRPLRPRRFVDH